MLADCIAKHSQRIFTYASHILQHTVGVRVAQRFLRHELLGQVHRLVGNVQCVTYASCHGEHLLLILTLYFCLIDVLCHNLNF